MSNEELAKKFTEHPKWEWLDGMSNRWGDRYSEQHSAFIDQDDLSFYTVRTTWKPDLEDPSTLRLILELIRRVDGWGSAIVVRYADDLFGVFKDVTFLVRHDHRGIYSGSSEAQALWAAFKELK